MPDDPVVAPAAGGSGDRVMDRRGFLGPLGRRAPRRAARGRGARRGRSTESACSRERPRDQCCQPRCFRQGLREPGTSRVRTSSSSIDRPKAATSDSRPGDRAGSVEGGSDRDERDASGPGGQECHGNDSGRHYGACRSGWAGNRREPRPPGWKYHRGKRHCHGAIRETGRASQGTASESRPESRPSSI